jgi:predicted helicase
MTETVDALPLYSADPEIASGSHNRLDAITDEGITYFQSAYPCEAISKEDVFYYVYALLHSHEYREHYADNLSKELPRIPRVKTATDFWAFSKAGRNLAELHLNYETVAMYPATVTMPDGQSFDFGSSGLRSAQTEDRALYRVEKMRYAKRGKEKDLTTLIYNNKITVSGIPLEAYDYVVNGKPALDWVVERQCVKTDKDSGIVNDANDWAIETMQNPRYPLELLLRVITVSLETMKIVQSLPTLDILEN